jgi:hypothetical protein
MTRGKRDGTGLLRWYPRSWRHRYGDEFGALMEDTLDGRKPTLRLLTAIAWAGLRERAYGSGLVGTAKPAAERVRAGAIAVLCAWATFLVAGARFGKYSENFEGALPHAARAVGMDAYTTVEIAAVVGGALVLIGACIALPTFVRFLQGGGWPSIGRHVRRAAWTSAAAGAALGGLVPVAHSLTTAQRNGGSSAYSVAFVLMAILVSTALAMWTIAAVAITRRLALSRRVLVGEVALATLVVGTMVVMTGATATWWGTVASSAPWFLQGTRTGSVASPFEPQLAATMALMLITTLAALGAMSRVTRSWREWRMG